MDRYLSTTDGGTILNLGKIRSIFKPTIPRDSESQNTKQSRYLEPGIYVETDIDCYMRVLEMSEIESSIYFIDDVENKKIIERALKDSGWRGVLLMIIMTVIKQHLLGDSKIIDMSKVLSAAIHEYCVIVRSTNKKTAPEMLENES